MLILLKTSNYVKNSAFSIIAIIIICKLVRKSCKKFKLRVLDHRRESLGKFVDFVLTAVIIRCRVLQKMSSNYERVDGLQ